MCLNTLPGLSQMGLPGWSGDSRSATMTNVGEMGLSKLNQEYGWFPRGDKVAKF